MRARRPPTAPRRRGVRARARLIGRLLARARLTGRLLARARLTGRLLARARLIGLLLAALAGAAQAEARVEFVYADAGEGGASGGHVALRLGERVYHYQRDAEGVLVLSRDAWRAFEFQYRVVENRSLSASRIHASAERAERLRERLDDRFVAGLLEREHLAALRDDVALLEALAAAGRGAGFAMRGVGFFATGTPDGGAGPAPRTGLEALRARIERAHGPGFLDARRREAERALNSLTPEPAAGAGGRSGDAREAAAIGAYPFSQRYADAFAAALAVDVLRGAPPLRRAALRALPGESGALGPAERAALRARLEALSSALAALVASPRPDWGFAFLQGAARLAALEASLSGDRLLVLDALPDMPARRRAPDAARALAAHRAWRDARLAAARDAVLARPADERALAALEREAALHGELLAALREGALPRPVPGAPAPEGRGQVTDLPRPVFAKGPLAPHLAVARRRVASAERARAKRDGYDLFTRNCVTELLRDVESALAGEPALPSRGARPPLAFVPFVAERVVSERWPASRPRALLSQRRAAAARARSASWLAGLRESTTLTSTLYAPHPGDSIFLFFTDDASWARPLLGTANLAVGVAAGAAGLLWLPVDGGDTLSRGARGAASSLPELFFFNIRKGTFPFALPPETSTPATPRPDRRRALRGEASRR